MKRRGLILGVAVLAFSACFCYAAKPEPTLKQAAASEPAVWNFGKVKPDTLTKKEFPLKNNSGRIMHIKDVTTSCGCTASKVKDKTLLPGGSTAIEVSFNSSGYRGQVTQFVYVHNDNNENPILKFAVKIEVADK